MPISLKANSDGSAEILNGANTVLKINNDNSLEAQGSLETSELVSDTWKNVDGTENYKCRAWVNFDGTTTPPTIRASGNVSSVVRNATGDYAINFIVPMKDANYIAFSSTGGTATTRVTWINDSLRQRTTSSISIANVGTNLSGLENASFLNVAIFR